MLHLWYVLAFDKYLKEGISRLTRFSNGGHYDVEMRSRWQTSSFGWEKVTKEEVAIDGDSSWDMLVYKDFWIKEE